jgi:hypothetical protein
MRKHHAFAAALLAATLVACGADDPPPPLEEPTIGDPEAYFGMERCTCYEFRSADPNDTQLLGVAVESVADLYSPGEPWHFVRYRRGGRILRQDYLVPSDPDLLLKQVSFRAIDQTDEIWTLKEPMPLMRFPADRAGQQVTQTGAVTLNGTLNDFNLVSDYVTQTVEGVSFDGVEREDVEAVRISYSGIPWADENHDRWFVPNRGLVKLEFSIGGARTTFTLDRKRTLEGGCPTWEPTSPVKDVCGSTDTN